jgi:hypothetical protein
LSVSIAELDLTPALQAIGVVVGVQAPTGTEPPLQLILVDTSASPWTATPLANQL